MVATTQPRAVMSVESPSSSPSGENPHFTYDRDNQPNAEVLLPSLRQSGYTLERAVGDLVDNSLDAGADVVLISLEKQGDDWSLTIADNGCGMDDGRLDQMMRLGSRAEHDLTTDLGAFGMGSTTASLSLGRLQHVVTTPGSETYWSAAADLDVCLSRREFVKHLATAQEMEVDGFRTAFTRYGIDAPATGTIVKVTHCDRIDRKAVKPAESAVTTYVGRTYRRFIDAGKRFYVNGYLVSAIDPLMREHAQARVMLDETFEYAFPDSHPRAGETASIGVVLVQLPDFGGPEVHRSHGISTDKSGFYLMRNHREIVDGTTLDFYARHQALSRFRGELLLPASLDSDIGVTFLKSAWNLNLSQSLRDKIGDIVAPYIRQARKEYYRSTPTTTEQVTHDEATRRIRERAPFLRRPATEIERRKRGASKDDPSKPAPADSTDQTRTPQRPRVQSALADIATIRVMDLGPTAPFYEADLDGRRIVITYNGQHPFYQRFILENRDNPSMITGIDYLVYSLAAAELLARDEATYQFIERMREDSSFNLRQLLVT